MFGKEKKRQNPNASADQKPSVGQMSLFDQAAQPKKPANPRSPQRAKSTNSRRASSRAVVSTESFTVDGIEVELSRKKVKNLTLRVKDAAGPVQVSAPVWTPTASVEAFVCEKKPWIAKRRQAIAAAPRALAQEATPEEIAQWRATIEAAVPPLMEKWEPVMGVRHTKIAYRNMTSRWGSCTPSTGRICINIQLANYPQECLEYVVVHELCHLLERGHGDRFKSLMTHYLPDWKARRAILRGRKF